MGGGRRDGNVAPFHFQGCVIPVVYVWGGPKSALANPHHDYVQ